TAGLVRGGAGLQQVRQGQAHRAEGTHLQRFAARQSVAEANARVVGEKIQHRPDQGGQELRGGLIITKIRWKSTPLFVVPPSGGDERVSAKRGTMSAANTKF